MSEVLSDYTGKITPPEVEINGIRFSLGEFKMRTKALWLDIAEEYDLKEKQQRLQSDVLPALSRLSSDIRNDPRVKSVETRLDKVRDKHDALLEAYATDDEPEDIDAKLEELLVRMESSADELNRILAVVQEEAIAQARVAEEGIAELMEVQDRAKVDFAYRLAKVSGKTELEFEEFFSQCGAEDLEAASKLVDEGNASWASLYTDRMQEKPKRTSKKN
ncbi:MAG: hypothetical protein LC687_01500 [Actinobacteria bacterium]|nr:hypothetical protein [Actinomycetota bacterium]